MRVAFIGLGAMGLPMAVRLVEAGFEVHGFDIANGQLEKFSATGGKVASTPSDAARHADAIVIVTATGAQTAHVLFDEDGAAAAARSGAIVIMHCTQSPAMAKQSGEMAAAAGLLALDAPVSGGVVGARSGGLTIMASGSDQAFAAADPLLRPLAKTVYRIGSEIGQGSTVKTINQLLAGVHIAVGAEALALGAKAGIDPKLLLEILMSGAAASWMLGNRGPRMLESEPQIASAVDIFVKDLGLVDDLARTLRQPTPIAAAALQQFLSASARGDGKRDDSQVIAVYEAMGRVTLRGKT